MDRYRQLKFKNVDRGWELGGCLGVWVVKEGIGIYEILGNRRGGGQRDLGWGFGVLGEGREKG